MKATPTKRFAILAGLSLALLAGLSGPVSADDDHDDNRKKIAVTAYSDFAIVPPNLGLLIPGTDGDLYSHRLPLVGRFIMSGSGVSLDAKIHFDVSGELDATGTGVFWFPTTITTTIDGVKTIIFEGQGTVN